MLALISTVVAVMWAIYPFILKQCQEIHYLVIWMIMSIVAATFSVFVVLLAKPISKRELIGTDYVLIISASILGPVCGFLLFVYIINSVQNITPYIAIVYTSPVFAALFGYMFFKERINTMQLIGVIIVCFGILLVIMGRRS